MNYKKQELALKYMKEGKNLFITGPAGAGKTYIINKFRNTIKCNVTSTTGISAILINGKTLHSWAGIGLGKGDLLKKVLGNKRAKSRWIKTKILIIDEISMLNPDLFDKLEKIARTIRKSDKPFGGIQLILSGDFCQLPVVKCEKFCFESKNWEKCVDKTIYLDKIIRQQDPIFIKMLEELRLGIHSDISNELLLSRMIEYPDIDILPTKLYSTNKSVDIVNKTELLKLNNEIYTFTPKIEVIKKNYNPEFMIKFLIKGIENLKLCIGCQVMLSANIDVENKLSNGSRGIIIGFDEKNLPIVKFKCGINVSIEYYKTEYKDDDFNIIIHRIPLKLAWAITIHKSQGSTLDCVQTNLNSENIFEFGQAYTALSRVRDLNNLYLDDIDIESFKCNPKVSCFYNTLI